MLKIIKPTSMNLEVLRLALGLVGVRVDDPKVLAKIWIIKDQLDKKGQDLNLRDAVDIEMFVDKKYTLKTITFKDKPKDEPKTETNSGTAGNDSADYPPATAV